MEKKTPFEDLDPLVIKRIIPVDVAPFTLRFDMVVLCEKMKASDLPESKRSAQKPIKKANKKHPAHTNRKHWQNTRYGNASRPNLFPTVEMVRNFTSVRRPKTDFQKRDSLYPVPLRGALYEGTDCEQYYPREEYPLRREYGVGAYDRYTDFRRDLQDALEDSAYAPPENVTNRKLAYAHALLDEGIRMANEVMEVRKHPQMSSRATYYDRPGGSRYTSSRYRY